MLFSNEYWCRVPQRKIKTLVHRKEYPEVALFTFHSFEQNCSLLPTWIPISLPIYSTFITLIFQVFFFFFSVALFHTIVAYWVCFNTARITFRSHLNAVCKDYSSICTQELQICCETLSYWAFVHPLSVDYMLILSLQMLEKKYIHIWKQVTLLTIIWLSFELQLNISDLVYML